MIGLGLGLRALAVLALCPILASGCGGSHGDAPSSASVPDTATTSGTPATTTASAPSTPGLGPSLVSESDAMHNSSGYHVKVLVSTYGPFKASAAPALPYSGRTAPGSCTFNPATDAVIPISWSIANTTGSFPTDAYISFGWSPNGLDNPPMTMALDLGGTCEISPLESYTPYTAISAGSSATGDAYLVVGNYYTPSYPGGNTEELRQFSFGWSVNRTHDDLFFPDDSSAPLCIGLLPEKTCSPG